MTAEAFSTNFRPTLFPLSLSLSSKANLILQPNILLLAAIFVQNRPPPPCGQEGAFLNTYMTLFQLSQDSAFLVHHNFNRLSYITSKDMEVMKQTKNTIKNHSYSLAMKSKPNILVHGSIC